MINWVSAVNTGTYSPQQAFQTTPYPLSFYKPPLSPFLKPQSRLIEFDTHPMLSPTNRASETTFQRVLYHSGMAAGLVLAGLLLKGLPTRNLNYGFSRWVPSDPKEWLKVGLGIAAVGQINKAFNWAPPAWLKGVEMVGLINLITLPLNKKESIIPFLTLLPLVPAVISIAAQLNNSLTDRLHDELNVPPLLTRISISVGIAALGLSVFRPMQRKMAQILTQFLKFDARELTRYTATGAVAGGMMTCANGCCSSLICLSEAGQIASGVGTWLKTHEDKPSSLGNTL